MPGRTDDKIRCSFCGKTQDQVRKLIAGTDNVYICDDCIELCSEILEEEFADVVGWLSTLANMNGIDLETAVRNKYVVHPKSGFKS